MDREAIFKVMEKYFADKKPEAVQAPLREQPVTSLLQDSLDLVDFLVFLEEELKLEGEIDVHQFGPSVMNKNFGELADVIAKVLAEGVPRKVRLESE
jgi:acyl carrier protein